MPDSPFGHRLVRSLLSVLLGWACAILVAVAVLALLGQLSEMGPIAAWTLGFVLLGWALVGLPIVGFVDVRSRLFQSWWSSPVGSAIAYVTFLVLAGRWFQTDTLEFSLTSGFSALVGGIAWRTYAVLGRNRSNPAPSPPSRP